MNDEIKIEKNIQKENNEKENKLKKESENTPENKALKQARYGIILFCIIHFLYEGFIGNIKMPVIPVVFNFSISIWYIKKQLEKGLTYKNYFITGLTVSAVIFLIRLIIGTIALWLFLK